MAALRAGLDARFSSTTNVALFVIITFSFFTGTSGTCENLACERDPEMTCCGSLCIYGSSCLGQVCSFDSDCSFNQSCCDDRCVQGKSCLGQRCTLNDHCSEGQSCCGKKCKSGLGCIGEPCQSGRYSDCQYTESCCGGTCSKHECLITTADLPYILVPAVGFVLFLIISAILIYLRYKRRRLQMGAIISTNNITTNTHVSTASVTQCNPLFQPEGPPSDQPTVPPPPYTATPTEGAVGMYAHQTDSFASAQRKTSNAV